MVGVDLLLGAQLAVVAVADAQHDGGQQGGEQRPGQHGDLDVVGRRRSLPKASSPMSRETVKPIPPRIASPRTSIQASPLGERRAGEAGYQAGGGHDPERLADDQAQR